MAAHRLGHSEWRELNRQIEGAGVETGSNDPLAAIRSLDALGSTDGASLLVLVLVNFHRFLNGPEVIQTLAAQISKGKQNRTFVVILAPVVQIPIELEKLFVVLEHDLPHREQPHEGIRSGSRPGEWPRPWSTFFGPEALPAARAAFSTAVKAPGA